MNKSAKVVLALLLPQRIDVRTRRRTAGRRNDGAHEVGHSVRGNLAIGFACIVVMTIKALPPGVPSSSPPIQTTISIIVATSGSSENDIAGNHNPKCVVADKGDIDEHAHDREPHKNERESKSKPHYASPLRCNKERMVLRSTPSHSVPSTSGHIKCSLRGRAQEICARRIYTCDFAFARPSRPRSNPLPQQGWAAAGKARWFGRVGLSRPSVVLVIRRAKFGRRLTR
jgi:hypothetical protein